MGHSTQRPEWPCSLIGKHFPLPGGTAARLAPVLHGHVGGNMSALDILLATAVTVVAVLVGISLRRIGAAWLTYRGPRLVICPENQRSASLVLDVLHAVATAAGGNPELRLAGCSRWPGMSGCGQPCLAHVRGKDSRLENVLRLWYEGKYCTWCGQPVEEAYWTACKPAVLTPGKTLLRWDEIPAQETLDVLATALPVCFHCYVRAQAETGHVGWAARS